MKENKNLISKYLFKMNDLSSAVTEKRVIIIKKIPGKSLSRLFERTLFDHAVMRALFSSRKVDLSRM